MSLSPQNNVKKSANYKTNFRRNLPETEHKKLGQKLQEHYAYYGVTGNIQKLGEFAERVRLS